MDNKCSEESCINCIHKSKYGNICYKDMQNIKEINNPEAKRLVEVTKQAFFEGIKYARKGNRIGDISHAIGEYVKSQGYSVVREFEGHGIGKDMHEEPEIPNYGKAGRGIRLEPGMTLAIEPTARRQSRACRIRVSICLTSAKLAELLQKNSCSR